MQKRLIQAGVLLAFSSPSMAYTLIDTDIAYWNVYGTLKASAKFLDGRDNDYTFGDSEIGTRARYSIFDSLSVAAGVEANVNLDPDEERDEDDLDMSEYYAGISLRNFGTITYGKHATSSDDVAAVDYSEIYGGKASLNAVGEKDEAIKYTYNAELLRLNATYGFPNGDNQRELKELFGSYRIIDLKIQAGIGNSKTETTFRRQESTYTQLSFFYNYIDYELGTTYYYNKSENKNNSLRDQDSHALAFAGQLAITPDLTSFGGIEYIARESKTDSLDGDEQNVYLGAKYLFADLIRVYAEANYRKTLSGDSQMNYGVGASMSF
ncbi:porin [Vibrio sp. AK197]